MVARTEQKRGTPCLTCLEKRSPYSGQSLAPATSPVPEGETGHEQELPLPLALPAAQGQRRREANGVNDRLSCSQLISSPFPQ